MRGSANVLGYRLTARRHDLQAPEGAMQIDWIALAQSAVQADRALRAEIGLGWDVTLVAAGQRVTKEAQARGLEIGVVARV